MSIQEKELQMKEKQQELEKQRYESNYDAIHSAATASTTTTAAAATTTTVSSNDAAAKSAYNGYASASEQMERVINYHLSVYSC